MTKNAMEHCLVVLQRPCHVNRPRKCKRNPFPSHPKLRQAIPLRLVKDKKGKTLQRYQFGHSLIQLIRASQNQTQAGTQASGIQAANPAKKRRCSRVSRKMAEPSNKWVCMIVQRHAVRLKTFLGEGEPTKRSRSQLLNKLSQEQSYRRVRTKVTATFLLEVLQRRVS